MSGASSHLGKEDLELERRLAGPHGIIGRDDVSATRSVRDHFFSSAAKDLWIATRSRHGKFEF